MSRRNPPQLETTTDDQVAAPAPAASSLSSTTVPTAGGSYELRAGELYLVEPPTAPSPGWAERERMNAQARKLAEVGE